MSSHPQSMAYLSILGWPSGFGHDDRVEALVASAGMGYDRATAEAKIEPPTVVGMIDPLVRDEVLRVLYSLGVLAMAPSEDEMALYPDPEPIKRVARFPGTGPTAFAADDNDEPAWTFTADDIRLVVSGTARFIETRTNAKRRSLGHHRFGSAASRMASSLTSGVQVIKTERTRTKEFMDIHLFMEGKPRLLRLTGLRTLIRSLENLDDPPSLLAPPDPVELLEPHIPGVRIDRGFGSFNPPTKIRMRSGSGRLGVKKRTPEAFGFYSVWLAIIDRMMRGEG